MANDFISVNNDSGRVYEILDGPQLMIHSTSAKAVIARNAGGSYVDKSDAWWAVVVPHYTILPNPG